MLRLLLLLLIVVCTNAYSSEYKFKLKVYIPGETSHLGSLTHVDNKDGGFTRDLKIYDNDKLIGESLENFDKNSNILNAKKRDIRCNKNQEINFNNNIASMIIDGKQVNVDIEKGVTFGTGFFDKSRFSINESLSGGEPKILMLVPEKEDWFTLTSTKTEYISYNGGKALMLTIAPKSFIIRMFAKEIIFIFDTSDKHKPLEFIGVLPFYNQKCEPTSGKIYFEEEKL